VQDPVVVADSLHTFVQRAVAMIVILVEYPEFVTVDRDVSGIELGLLSMGDQLIVPVRPVAVA
jgi:hypothetical protein